VHVVYENAYGSQTLLCEQKIVIQSSDFPVRRTGSYRHKKALKMTNASTFTLSLVRISGSSASLRTAARTIKTWNTHSQISNTVVVHGHWSAADVYYLVIVILCHNNIHSVKLRFMFRYTYDRDVVLLITCYLPFCEANETSLHSVLRIS